MHANLLVGIEEPAEHVRETLEQELDALDIDPELFRPVLERLTDLAVSNEQFFSLLIDAANKLAFPLANPHGRQKIFIAMPFDEQYRGTLDAIRDAARFAGFYAWRADEQAYTGATIPDVYLKGIAEAAIVIADFTANRQNVYFEAGYALSRGKPPLYIAEAGTVVHFDVGQSPILFFKDQDQLRQRLTSDLQKRVAAKPV